MACCSAISERRSPSGRRDFDVEWLDDVLGTLAATLLGDRVVDAFTDAVDQRGSECTGNTPDEVGEDGRKCARLLIADHGTIALAISASPAGSKAIGCLRFKSARSAGVRLVTASCEDLVVESGA